MIHDHTTEAPTSTSPTLAAALDYARRGWRVLPLHSIDHDGRCTCGRADCGSPAKHPRTASGLKDASTDHYQVLDWWLRWPTANVGIATGAESGMVVIDIDPRHGGNESLDALEAAHGVLPATVTACTGGGGLHFFFLHPGSTMKNRANVRPGIDVRGDGGYVVAAPSTHVSGGEYRWDEGRGPDEVDLAPLPDWLLRLIATPQPAPERNGHTTASGHGLLIDRALQYLARVGGVGEGERNGTAFRLAGHLAALDAGGESLSEGEIVELLRGWNIRNTPPLEDAELRQCVQSALVNGTPRADKPANDRQGQSHHQQADAPARPIRKYSFADLAAEFPALHPPVVDGLFRLGETVNIVAPPKAGKSWLGYLLGLSIIAGREWLGHSTHRGRVLLIDNELHPQTLAHRIPKVAAELGLFPDDWQDRLDVWPLRGNLQPLYRVADDLASIGRNTYKVIILDAKYRFGNGESENDNAAETALYNTLDQVAEQTGAAVVLIHHSSKGSQTDKRVTDVGAGAGAQSRAADCHIILREHEDDGVVVMDAAVRSFAPVEPVALRWSYPLWEVCGADTSLLRGRKTRQEERQTDRDREGMNEIVRALLQGPATRRELGRRTAISPQRLDRLVNTLHRDGQIVGADVTIKGNLCQQFSLPNVPE